MIYSLGHELEDNLSEACYRYLGEDFKSSVGTKEDIECGTDAYIYGLPVDFTYNMNGKDHTIILPKSIILSIGVEVKFGVRIGNSYNGFTKFKTPVLVIGIEANDAIVRMYGERIADCFYKQMEEIINEGQDQYWDYIDSVA